MARCNRAWDRGLSAIDITNATNVSLDLPLFDDGAPTVTATMQIVDTTLPAGLVVHPVDVAGNKASYAFSFEPLLSVDRPEVVGLDLYPNPANDKLYIKRSLFNVADLLIYDMTGKVCLQDRTASDSHAIDIQQLPIGAYTLVIRDAHGEIKRPFVIQR